MSPMNPLLLLRVHAGADVGSGHAMRCLALAEAWRDSGGVVLFGMRDCGPAFRQRLLDEDMRLETLSCPAGGEEDLRQTIALADRHEAAWVVLDGYCFRSEYQEAVARSGVKLLVVDDCGDLGPYRGDLLLNQNLHAREALYPQCEESTRLLLGTRFALLRREFLRTGFSPRRVRSSAKRLLVTLGGSDPTDVTPKVVEALRLLDDSTLQNAGTSTTLGAMPTLAWACRSDTQACPRKREHGTQNSEHGTQNSEHGTRFDASNLRIKILAGENNRHFAELRAATENSKLHISINSNANDMAKLYDWADVAIGAGGISCWERAFMGVPSLVIVLAENQTPIARELAAAGVAVYLGRGENLHAEQIAAELRAFLYDAPRREEMARRGRELVDGEGAARVVMRMLGGKLRIREVRPDDCRLLWRWVNEPAVREMSMSDNDHISWEAHVAWFDNRLADAKCHMFIAIDADDVPLGQIRFDVAGHEATISISIAGEHRGTGYGGLLIETAVAKFFAQTDVRQVNARIKPHNKASRAAFEKNGFRDCGPRRVRGMEIRQYVLCRTEDNGSQLSEHRPTTDRTG